jgi:hypothetical protein
MMMPWLSCLATADGSWGMRVVQAGIGIRVPDCKWDLCPSWYGTTMCVPTVQEIAQDARKMAALCVCVRTVAEVF